MTGEIVTYTPLPDGRTLMRVVYPDNRVTETILPAAKSGLMPGAAKGKRLTQSRGIDVKVTRY